VGTLHVRPILNMKSDGAKKMRAIAEEACALVKKYKAPPTRASTRRLVALGNGSSRSSVRALSRRSRDQGSFRSQAS